MYAVYQLEDGRLVSTGSIVAEDAILAARGYGKVSIADGSQNGVWNASTLSFDPPPPVTQLSKVDFLKRFMAAERIAIRALTDPAVVDFLHLLDLADYVDLADPETQQGVSYVAATYPSALTSARAAAILATG